MSVDTRKCWKRFWRRLACGALVCILLLLGAPFLLHELIGRMASGWFFHLKATAFPALWVNAGSLWFPALCLLVSMGLGHLFFRWMSNARGSSWRMRQSVCVFGLLLLGSAAAIAMSGVAHQLVWLAGSKWVHWIPDSPRMRGTKALRSLIMAIDEYHSRHGSYPDALQDLMRDDPEITSSMLWFHPDPNSPPENVVYRKPKGDNPSQAVLWTTLPDGACIVAFLNYSVRTVDSTKEIQSGQAENPHEP